MSFWFNVLAPPTAYGGHVGLESTAHQALVGVKRRKVTKHVKLAALIKSWLFFSNKKYP